MGGNPLRGRAAAAHAANTNSDMLQSMEVENATVDYCDEFVCTSSPAVEQTVKSFARDIIRLRHTAALYQPDVKYKDGFRSFQGRDNYYRLSWTRDLLSKPFSEVSRLQMLDKGVAQVDWVLTGQAMNTEVRIPMVSTITMNLLTGRITMHSEQWDLSGCSPPAAAMLTASRMLWALKATSRDASNDIAKATASFSSMDDDSSDVYMDPHDPTKFFQQQSSNNQMSDAFALATLAAALYAVYKAFEAVEMLNM